jgi:hypothetical protein
MKLLGTRFSTSVRQTAIVSWTHITGKIRAQAQAEYHRDLRLHQRIQCVNTFLMAKSWYTPQILPHPVDNIRQIKSAISRYIWFGEIFRIPLPTLYKAKDQGGWGLHHLEAKCRNMLLFRLHVMKRKAEYPTTCWMGKWWLLQPSTNPQQEQNPSEMPIFAINGDELSIRTRTNPIRNYKIYKRRI